MRSYAWESGRTLVLFDPIAPLPELPAGERVVCLTCDWHKRSTPELGYRVVAPPDGVEAVPALYEGERALWIPSVQALVVGDGIGALRDPSWLPAGETVDDVKVKLRSWLDLPVEVVCQTHGDPLDRVSLERLLA